MSILHRVFDYFFPAPDYAEKLAEIDRQIAQVRFDIRETKGKGRVSHLYARMADLKSKAVALEILAAHPTEKAAHRYLRSVAR